VKNLRSKSSVLVVIYVVLISSWFVTWLFAGDAFWWLTLMNRIAAYLFFPVPLILAWAILFRRLELSIPLLLPALIFAYLYHPYLFPGIAKTHEIPSELRVLTYNVLYSNRDYDAVADLIMTYHPDLVALQEVQPEMMARLRERLRADYPYSIMGTENNYGTTAIFSQHAFTHSTVLDLQADRPAVVVKTKVKDDAVTFVAVHMLAYGLWWVKPRDLPAVVMKQTADQNRQAEILLQEIEKDNEVVIIGCDCNSPETSSSYRILDGPLDNAARIAGWSLSKEELRDAARDTNLQHIDYVWYQGSVEPLGVYTIHLRAGSDHQPVLALFDMK
jgi:endonuclease/exonuclease/phosphatase (EEP) superfamily protein YafD